jgi:hypothetical protein
MRHCASCAQETHALEMLTNEAMPGEARRDLVLISWRGDPMKAPQPLQRLTRGVNILTRRRNVLSSLHLRHSAAHRDKRKESTMRGLTVRVTLAVLALVAALYLSTQRVGVAEAQTFNLEKAVTEAKTPAEHEAIASYYEKEAATAKDKAAEHHRLAEIYRRRRRPRRRPPADGPGGCPEKIANTRLRQR